MIARFAAIGAAGAAMLCGGAFAASTLLVSLGTTVHKYDAATGADQGVFASGFTATKGIGFDPGNGFVYVADYVANTVTKFNTAGSFISSFGTGNGPEGLVVDGAGNIFVANYNASTVTKYNPSGSLLATYSVGGPPAGMDMASNGDLLVNNYGGSILSHNGIGFSTFASGLTNNLPLAVDDLGNVYVAEYTGLKRLLKYSSTGTLLSSISLGYSSYGMAFNDETGELLVGNNSPGNAINRYNTSLGFLGTLTTPATAPQYMTVIPEPSRALLTLIGIAGLCLRRRRA